MNKKTIAALEKVFAAEVNDRLPFQSKAKIYEQLCADGLIDPMKRIFGAGGRFPVTVTGYALTEAGWLAYCASCGDADESP